MIEIIFRMENLDLAAELDDSLTAQNIVKLLPVESVVSLWGEEIFLGIQGIQSASVNRTRQVNVGDVAFSPEGNCICVFLGSTPASLVLGKPIAENPVIVIGKVLDPPKNITSVRGGGKVKVVVSDKTTPAPQKNDFVSERKLSQSEIDLLVKKLLEEKKRSFR